MTLEAEALERRARKLRDGAEAAADAADRADGVAVAAAYAAYQAPPRMESEEEAGRCAAACLRDAFGHEAWRTHQAAACTAALLGRDVVGVLPTGLGKTLLFALPALALPWDAVTVVVVPLTALVDDLLAGLEAVRAGCAVGYYGATPLAERARIADRLLRGAAPGPPQLLLCTPEMLTLSAAFAELLGALRRVGRLARVVFDEAHVVSEWGHDFRPVYTEMGPLRRLLLAGLPLTALTATAPEAVLEDVMRLLRIDPAQAHVVAVSARRLNLRLAVYERPEEAVRARELVVEYVTQSVAGERAGIVYADTRAHVDQLAIALTDAGVAAAPYHSGIDAAERREVLALWQADELRVVVATVAFGMGINKANVRFVLHTSMPKSALDLVQEAGRAGRDGVPADAVVLYRPADVVARAGMGDGTPRAVAALRPVVRYCENVMQCRGAALLVALGEAPVECGAEAKCDVCNGTVCVRRRSDAAVWDGAARDALREPGGRDGFDVRTLPALGRHVAQRLAVGQQGGPEVAGNAQDGGLTHVDAMHGLVQRWLAGALDMSFVLNDRSTAVYLARGYGGGGGVAAAAAGRGGRGEEETEDSWVVLRDQAED